MWLHVLYIILLNGIFKPQHRVHEGGLTSIISDPRVHAGVGGGGARGQNLVHLQKVIFLCQSFLDKHLSESMIVTWKIDTMQS